MTDELGGVGTAFIQLVDQGVDTCTVAYVPRMMANQARVTEHINKFVMVMQLYID